MDGIYYREKCLRIIILEFRKVKKKRHKKEKKSRVGFTFPLPLRWSISLFFPFLLENKRSPPSQLSHLSYLHTSNNHKHLGRHRRKELCSDLSSIVSPLPPLCFCYISHQWRCACRSITSDTTSQWNLRKPFTPITIQTLSFNLVADLRTAAA